MLNDRLSVMHTSLAAAGPFSCSQWQPTGSCLSRMQGYMSVHSQRAFSPTTYPDTCDHCASLVDL